MSVILQAVMEMEESAQRLRKLLSRVELPESDYTLSGAVGKLRGVLGGAYFTLGLDIVVYEGVKAEWHCFDGDKTYKTLTLDGVVNMVLAAHAQPGDSPVEAAEAILTAAETQPL